MVSKEIISLHFWKHLAKINLAVTSPKVFIFSDARFVVLWWRRAQLPELFIFLHFEPINTAYVNNEESREGYTAHVRARTLSWQAAAVSRFVCAGLCTIPSHLEQCQAGSECSTNIYLLNKDSTYLAPEEPGRCQTLGADSDYDNTNLKIKRITESGNKRVSDWNDSRKPQDLDSY